tara:strand:- start:997 stop:1347 length:351 start_codon:yes stop_codon:yes gene_type:complete
MKKAKVGRSVNLHPKKSKESSKRDDKVYQKSGVALNIHTNHSFDEPFSDINMSLNSASNEHGLSSNLSGPHRKVFGRSGGGTTTQTTAAAQDKIVSSFADESHQSLLLRQHFAAAN